MIQRFLAEPTLLMEVVRLGLLWIVMMGFWTFTNEQQAITLTFISAVIALFNRALVTPNQNVLLEKNEDDQKNSR